MNKNNLRELHTSKVGKVSDKWSLYLEEYDRFLQSYRARPINLLEIGVQNGGSLETWAEYFPDAKIIIGCDIDQNCQKLSYQDLRIKLVIGDASDAETFKKINEYTQTFDIVIEDGSHTSGDIIRAFARYFPMLSDDGIFIAEDLHCSYWSEYQGGLFHPYASITFFKHLADIINYEHWGIKANRTDILKGICTKYDCKLDEVTLSTIHSIEFINSICVIRKSPASKNLLGKRILVGNEDIVNSRLKEAARDLILVLNQENNEFSKSKSPPGESLVVALNELQKLPLLEEELHKAKDELQKLPLLEEELHKAKDELQKLPLLEEELHKAKDELSKLLSSKSWRLTSALRIFGSHARKLKKYLVEPNLIIKKIPKGYIENNNHSYQKWCETFDSSSEEKNITIDKKIREFQLNPLISVVMPVFNPNLNWLTEAINSVRTQIYGAWELCISDDCSTDSEVRIFLEKLAAQDSRIKVVFRETNGHISAASNSALEMADGEWIALMDQDDLLNPSALFSVVDAINDHPHARLIYSDEDKLDSRGARFDPYFKCDWNIDLFYSHNMFSHLGVFKTDLVKEVGGFRVGFEGSQDYDLTLRCIEKVTFDQIVHIPKVLYHWRAHDASTAKSLSTKSYAIDAGVRALREHFARLRINAVISPTKYGYRVRYLLNDSFPLVSILIPTRNGLKLIETCVRSILQKTSYPNYEIIIIDNGSDDQATIDFLEKVATDSRVRVLRDERPFNYSALNNLAAKSSRGEYLALLNNDLEVISPDWLEEMVSIATQSGVGAVGAKLWYPNKTLQHGGVILGLGGIAGHAHLKIHKDDSGYFGRAAIISSYSAVTGACLVVKKSTYELVGGLNEHDLTVAFNDIDFCLRLKKLGLRNIWTPYAEFFHYESATRGRDDSPEKIERFKKEISFMQNTYSEIIANDPAYSPKLSLSYDEDFALAWPPRKSLW